VLTGLFMTIPSILLLPAEATGLSPSGEKQADTLRTEGDESARFPKPGDKALET